MNEKPIALDLLRALAPRDLIETYNQARRVAGTIYHFIQEDLKQKYPHEEDVSKHFRNHQDYPLHKTWHNRRLSCVATILSSFKDCHPLLKEMGVDPK